jgi:hypothetical protein
MAYARHGQLATDEQGMFLLACQTFFLFEAAAGLVYQPIR